VLRYFALAVTVCLVAVLVGCAPSKGDIEKSIKDEIKSRLGVEATAVNPTKQSDGGYTGTATAANGDVYDITVAPASRRRAEWKAVVSQGTVERMLRDHLKNNLKMEVAKMELTKEPDGNYSGTATATNGETIEVRADPKPEGIALNAVVAQPTVERLVREDVEKRTMVKVKSLNLTRQGPGTYTGTLDLANGEKLNVSTRMEGGKLLWEYKPLQ
jgi:uncharacterized protein with FMN-binding domain